jgi:hypothetical protein
MLQDTKLAAIFFLELCAIPDSKNERLPLCSAAWKTIPWSSRIVFQQGKLNTMTGVDPIRTIWASSRVRVVLDVPAPVAVTLEIEAFVILAPCDPSTCYKMLN